MNDFLNTNTQELRRLTDIYQIYLLILIHCEDLKLH